MVKVKRVLILSVVVLVLSVTVVADPVKVFPSLWDQDAIKKAPLGPGYPVLAVTQVIDGDTFEALVHIAPLLVAAVDVRVLFPDGEYLDTPEMQKTCREQAEKARGAVIALLQQAESVTVSFIQWDKYPRWACVVTVETAEGKVDLASWIKQNHLTKADLCPDP